MNYTLTKTPKGKKFYYEVKDENGKIVATRTSPRTYVAVLINTKMNGYYAWFGRYDLIGKGDSRHFIGKPDTAVVKLLTEEDKLHSAWRSSGQ